MGHCSSTLADGSVIVTGGETVSNRFGTRLTEVFNATTLRWEKRADMQQGRFYHVCTSVWLETNPSVEQNDGIIAQQVQPYHRLGLVVAGGRMLNTLHIFINPGAYRDKEHVRHSISSVELYVPWNNTWVNLPLLPFVELNYRMVATQVMSLSMYGLSKFCLLGGDYQVSKNAAIGTNGVWELLWNDTSRSYSWEEGIDIRLRKLS